MSQKNNVKKYLVQPTIQQKRQNQRKNISKSNK